eukprot:GFUD01013366.1.p1 GENE.GFUD01013366.1~~GFUD01013366.1.p1  ORF type:complete len:648 (+),score=195.80 GFUD01013366.1:551-2494(+)
MGLLELSRPVQFEPVGQVTTVFFDDKNQQVFSVRSGGATGVVIKSPHHTSVITYRMEDHGPIISIKLSPNLSVLSVQRSKQSVEFLNVTNLESEYSQAARAKNSVILGFVWTSNTEVVFITDHGIEIYSISPEKKTIKYVRSSSVTIAWYCYSPVNHYLVTSSKVDTSQLQVWAIRNSTAYKLGMVELDTILVKDKDVSLMNVYNQTFLRVNINQGDGEIAVLKEIQLYCVLNDQVTLTHVLTSLDCPGPVGLHTVDNLVLVHSQTEARSRLYDLKLPGTPHQENCSVSVLSPSLSLTTITNEGTPVPYSPAWVVFLPNILVDARKGHMWTLNLKLGSVLAPDPLTLTKFFLNREAGKVPLLKLLKSSLQSTSTELSTLCDMFTCVVAAYNLHQNIASGGADGNSSSATKRTRTLSTSTSFTVPPQTSTGSNPAFPDSVPPAVVLDQADIFTNVFSSSSQEGVAVTRLQSVLVEYLLCLLQQGVTPRQFIYELLINLCVKTEQFYQLHQYLQYHVIGDSKPVACLLLSLESAYKPARQLALDMMTRLGTATEEMIEIFLAEGKLVSALSLVKANGLVDTVSARKFLEAAEKTEDRMLFFNVFSFFEERNLRLRGSGNFSRGEQCDPYVKKFKEMFLETKRTPAAGQA